MRLLAGLILFFLVSGCGYIPSAKYARGVLGERVFVNVDIYAADPENTVIIKDAIHEALISRFRVSLAEKSEAVTQLDVGISSLSFDIIERDSNGFITAQRANIVLSITRRRAKEAKNYAVVGSYDFDVDANGVVSDAKRFEAIKFASLRALESLVAQLAVEGVK